MIDKKNIPVNLGSLVHNNKKMRDNSYHASKVLNNPKDSRKKNNKVYE